MGKKRPDPSRRTARTSAARERAWALRHDGQLTWATQQRPTIRDDVIAFFDQVAAQRHEVPRIVLIDNAGIHKGNPIEKKRRHWAKYGLYLYYLPPYSLELNRIEIL
jgi:hypothetical protein